VTALGGWPTVTLALLIGLLLGSVLPADLLARRRHVDIRSVGDGNPGAYNVYKELGWAPGLVTLAYDASVGVVSIAIARFIGASEVTAYAAGIMAVVGHCFPVQRRFHGGGQGMAATAGMLVYGIAIALSQGLLSAVDIGALVVILAITYAVTRRGSLTPIVMLPVLMLRLFLAGSDWSYLFFMTLLSTHILAVQVATTLGRIPVREVGSHGVDCGVEAGSCPTPSENAGR
jgi:glycerol-3-phosphate acyltransferase PlsY